MELCWNYCVSAVKSNLLTAIKQPMESYHASINYHIAIKFGEQLILANCHNIAKLKFRQYTFNIHNY